jgi:hypothetical protein
MNVSDENSSTLIPFSLSFLFNKEIFWLSTRIVWGVKLHSLLPRCLFLSQKNKTLFVLNRKTRKLACFSSYFRCDVTAKSKRFHFVVVFFFKFKSKDDWQRHHFFNFISSKLREVGLFVSFWIFMLLHGRHSTVYRLHNLSDVYKEFKESQTI